MKQNKIAMKTMAIKARVANFLRTELYGYSNNDYQIKYGKKKSISEIDSKAFLEKLFTLVHEMNSELGAYKRKRQDKAKLLEKRLNSPQTKSMIKKLRGKVKKDLVDSQK